jgi:hypothetical protein
MGANFRWTRTAYLNYLFEKLPAAKSEQALLALLPQNLKMEDLNG